MWISQHPHKCLSYTSDCRIWTTGTFILEKQLFFAQYVACWQFFSWRGPHLVPWCVRGLILRAFFFFFFFSCRAQSVHIGNEQQCGCDISENANTIISPPPSLPAHQYLCAHGGGSEIPGPEFALSWQGKRLIRTHAPLLVTLPASPAQHATLDLNVFFFFFFIQLLNVLRCMSCGWNAWLI